VQELEENNAAENLEVPEENLNHEEMQTQRFDFT
jgi:hypothetical protein